MSMVLDNVYRQRVLQTVTSLLVPLLVFRTHDLLKITNIKVTEHSFRAVSSVV